MRIRKGDIVKIREDRLKKREAIKNEIYKFI